MDVEAAIGGTRLQQQHLYVGVLGEAAGDGAAGGARPDDDVVDLVHQPGASGRCAPCTSPGVGGAA